MGLVDQHQVALLHVVGPAMDRLDAGKQDPRLDIAAAEPGRIDPRRRLGPQSHHLGMVLGDQLAHVGDHENALVGPLLQHALDERGQHDRLAASCRDHDQRMAVLLGKVLVDRRDGSLLVGTEAQHDASSRASLIQLVPSARR